MAIRKDIEDIIINGLEQLIKEGSSKKYWNSNRATSDAIIALNICLPKNEYSNLRTGALRQLLSQSELIGDKRHWMEEIWDTSVATLALATEPYIFTKEISEASEWLYSKYLTDYNCWNDELWETLWAINVLSFLNKKVPNASLNSNDLSGVTEWLMKLVNTPSEGMLINWSSTALFVLFGSSPSLPGIDQEQYEKIVSIANRCGIRLRDADITRSDELLWTPEAWSNALVIWAISSTKNGQLDELATFKVIKWFNERIASIEIPTEDRAFSCAALFKYLEYLLIVEVNGNNLVAPKNTLAIEELKEKLKTRIANKLKKRVVDYNPRLPIISTDFHPLYYSINLYKKATNIFLILSFTFLLSFLSWKSELIEGKMKEWIIIIPVILGTLASIAQLANFTLISRKKK